MERTYGCDNFHYGVRHLMTEARFDILTGADRVSNTCDAFGQLERSTFAMGGATRTLDHLYDAAGRRTRLTYPGGQSVTYGYDSADRLTGLYSGTDTTSPLATWTYNIRGLPTARAEAGGSGMEWTWDPIERLASERHAFVPTTNNLLATFAYNPASQIVTRTRNNDAYVWTGANRLDTYTVNGLNQYASVNNVNFDYDDNGNLINDGSRTYTYDVENRLASSASGGQTTTLRYDPLGRLWEVAGPSGTTRFLWDGDTLVSEYDGANAFLRRYTHGFSAGDDPIVWTETGGITRYLHADHQGSVVAIAGQSGAAYAINRYDEWGRPAATDQGRFGYTGQIWLPELGLYHYKARMYSPLHGRFMQTDPVGYEGGINLYTYVGNDPVNLIDPNGTCGTRIANVYSASCSGATVLGIIGDWRGNRQPNAAQAVQEQGLDNETEDDERVQLACVGQLGQACRQAIADFFHRILGRRLDPPMSGARRLDFGRRAGWTSGGRNMENSRAAIAERVRRDLRQLTEDAQRRAADCELEDINDRM